MAQLVERLTTDPRSVFPVTRAKAAAYARQLAAAIEQLPELERFPEGAVGVLIYVLLADRALVCADPGDFGHSLQGVDAIVRAAAKVVREDVFG
jgi:uncharacterized membrane protein